MCGIIGFTGASQAAPVLLSGLKRLEYRGYDSAGIAVQCEGEIRMLKATGKVDTLIERYGQDRQMNGVCGIGHTRWATHGAPSDINAHPHMSMDGLFAIVHNGIIENYAQIRKELIDEGVKFLSETDTEVIVQLLMKYYDGNFQNTVLKTLSRLEGSYAVGIMCRDFPGVLYAAREASPLIIGLGAGENFFASDITALVSHTKNVIDLDDGEVAEIRSDSISIFDHAGRPVEKTERHITWDVAAAEKNGYEHFMLKEIMEQPNALKATIDPRVRDGRIVLDDLDLDMSCYDRIMITACGSAYHAGCVGRSVIETLCRIPVETELASELRYRDFVMDEKNLVIVVSQSGETADTIAALRECRSRGATVLAIVNVVGSSIAKLADHVIYTWAGPEIAVATTKGYTTQVAVLTMFAIWAADRLGRIEPEEYSEMVSALMKIPERAQRTLDLNARVRKLAKKYHDRKSLFFIGRNLDYSSCLEGSLKLKEISYIHSEAYAAGELKHGTIALIEPGRLVVALCCCERLFDKTVSNIQQVKARGAKVLAVALESNRRIFSEADDVLLVPSTHRLLVPIVEIIPLQLFAYFVAGFNGCDIDKPKNLAKSVTVE
ncbi:MAG: glutamine--fructose-6-phosphate transaminase (isomerizing) [Oscillospiraceae bacterium]|nr:glutamine--fructose-6-phosphate transaminase (isomerizing) [Oscillospiraceae bacterium]